MKQDATNPELVILVDGSSFLFRAFHALPPLTNSKGQPTGVIYGVVNMLHKLCKEYITQHIIIIFDAPGKTFRDELYPEYKAHRDGTPPELKQQFIPLTNFLQAMGFPIVIIDGVEADDVIATMTYQATSQNKKVLIATGDKDLAQLVSHNVTLVNTMTQTILTPEIVKEKFGVAPEQIIDYLTLVGDSSDNIPGVKMCGPKTAMKWLQQYNNIDNLLTNIQQIKGKIALNLQEFIPKINLTKTLVTVKTDVPLPAHINELTLSQPNTQKLIDLCNDLEFKTWLLAIKAGTWFHGKKIIKHELVPSNNETNITINNHKDFLDLITIIKQQNLIAFCIKYSEKKILGISFAFSTEKNFFIKISDSSAELKDEFVMQNLKQIYEDKEIKKIGYNLKLDYQILKRYNIQAQAFEYDILLENYLLSSGTQKPEDRQDDASTILKMHNDLYYQLSAEHQAIFHNIEMPLMLVLAEMEYHGVLIDPMMLKTQKKQLISRINALTHDAYKLAGEEFNLNSPKQIQHILFDKLKLPKLNKTPSGQVSTAENVLQELAFDYALPKIILEYRGLSKLVTTYLEGLPKRMNTATHRIHTNYQQAVTATGRLSSIDPNLQNIPIRSEEGRKIRQCFIAPPNHKILTADYSQIELRIMAHLSQDDNLLLAFKNADDVHSATAANLFHIPLTQVTSEHRRKAKAVNFGLIYGMSAFGLSKQIDVTRQEAQEIIDEYFKHFPKVLEYMQFIRNQAHANGYVTTLHCRKLMLPEINSANFIKKRASERMAINAPMQGTAAEIIKSAMIEIQKWLVKNSGKAYMIMQVHDELVFEIHKDYLPECKLEIKNIMENIVKLSVPLIVNIGIGDNWDAAHS